MGIQQCNASYLLNIKSGLIAYKTCKLINGNTAACSERVVIKSTESRNKPLNTYSPPNSHVFTGRKIETQVDQVKTKHRRYTAGPRHSPCSNV